MLKIGYPTSSLTAFQRVGLSDFASSPGSAPRTPVVRELAWHDDLHGEQSISRKPAQHIKATHVTREYSTSHLSLLRVCYVFSTQVRSMPREDCERWSAHVLRRVQNIVSSGKALLRCCGKHIQCHGCWKTRGLALPCVPTATQREWVSK